MILTSLTNSSITKIKQNKKPSQPQSTQKKRKKERLEGTSTTYENKVVGVHLIWGPDFYTGPLYIQRACPLYGKKKPKLTCKLFSRVYNMQKLIGGFHFHLHFHCFTFRGWFYSTSRSIVTFLSLGFWRKSPYIFINQSYSY